MIIAELPEKTVFTRQEAAAILKISLSTLDAIESSELPRIRLGKHIRILRQDLANFLFRLRDTGKTQLNSVEPNKTPLDSTKHKKTRYFKFFWEDNEPPVGWAQFSDEFGDIDEQVERALHKDWLPGVKSAEITEEEFLQGVEK